MLDCTDRSYTLKHEIFACNSFFEKLLQATYTKAKCKHPCACLIKFSLSILMAIFQVKLG